VGGWPGGYLQNALEELNSGLPRTNPNSGRAEDLNQGPPDFKSSALKPFGQAASTMFFYVDWLKIKVFGVIERNRHKHVYSWFPFLPAETLWTSTKQRQTLTTHNTNRNCCEHFYAYFMGQPLSKQLYMGYWPGVRSRYMGYWPRVRPTWLDVGQVLFFFLLVYGSRRSRDNLQPDNLQDWSRVGSFRMVPSLSNTKRILDPQWSSRIGWLKLVDVS